ncbi:hypothetical protein CP_0530 [Chlamydia pneumoniae AR39]|uniref:Uncharacterized protein n=1 Tax=Chlamydia pneumoniae TaxID=83558 RepID=Q9K253_CHLPN|nr:hypothetical protein CP_0530 [Chlamydia pneumoniae AR39]
MPGWQWFFYLYSQYTRHLKALILEKKQGLCFWAKFFSFC